MSATDPINQSRNIPFLRVILFAVASIKVFIVVVVIYFWLHDQVADTQLRHVYNPFNGASFSIQNSCLASITLFGILIVVVLSILNDFFTKELYKSKLAELAKPPHLAKNSLTQTTPGASPPQAITHDANLKWSLLNWFDSAKSLNILYLIIPPVAVLLEFDSFQSSELTNRLILITGFLAFMTVNSLSVYVTSLRDYSLRQRLIAVTNEYIIPAMQENLRQELKLWETTKYHREVASHLNSSISKYVDKFHGFDALTVPNNPSKSEQSEFCDPKDRRPSLITVIPMQAGKPVTSDSLRHFFCDSCGTADLSNSFVLFRREENGAILAYGRGNQVSSLVSDERDAQSLQEAIRGANLEIFRSLRLGTKLIGTKACLIDALLALRNHEIPEILVVRSADDGKLTNSVCGYITQKAALDALL